MNKKGLRPRNRDSVLYATIRECKQAFCKAHGISSYSQYFSDLLGFAPSRQHTAYQAIVQNNSEKKFSLDDFQVCIRELDEYAMPIINRLLDGTNLVCLPITKTTSKKVDFNSFSLLNFEKNGLLATDILNALADGEISEREKAILVTDISSILGLLATLLSELKAAKNG
jgi:hypothetical protein